jgi:hypothetical protein
VKPSIEQRRSTRVPIQVLLQLQAAESGSTELCQGETVVVNLHGALIETKARLKPGMKVGVYVPMTDKSADATVVHFKTDSPFQFGIELNEPINIWGIALAPDDWDGEPPKDSRKP